MPTYCFPQFFFYIILGPLSGAQSQGSGQLSLFFNTANKAPPPASKLLACCIVFLGQVTKTLPSQGFHPKNPVTKTQFGQSLSKLLSS